MFKVQSHLPLSIVKYGVSKHYACSQVSDRCPLGYLFILIIFWAENRQILDKKSLTLFGGGGGGTFKYMQALDYVLI